MTRTILATCCLLIASIGSAPPDAAAENLNASLKELILANLPSPLYADDKHWGKKKRGLTGGLKNDGRWWKIRIEGRELPGSLDVQVRDMRPAGPNRKTFNLQVHMKAGILFERQTWKLGVRLYSGSTRARVQLHLNLACEVTTRFENKGGLLPDVVIRMRVLNSDFRYDGLVVEHTVGVGGDAAKLIGEALIGIVKQVKPSLERNLLERANVAIQKAGDTKEVRISLMGISGGEKK